MECIGGHRGLQSLGVGRWRADRDHRLGPQLRLFTISVGIDGNARGSCGIVDVGVGMTATFTHTAPSSFSLKVKARFDSGELGTRRPTFYNA